MDSQFNRETRLNPTTPRPTVRLMKLASLATLSKQAFSACAVLLLICLPASQASAQFSVSLESDMVLDNDGLELATGGNFSNIINGSAFQQDVLLSHGGYQYAVWYHTATDQDIFLSRRDLTGNVWETFDTGFDMEVGNQDWNSHNIISMGISSDGRIHLAFDHHVDPLRYVTTDPGFATTSSSNWNASGLKAERNSLNVGGSAIPRITYPRFTNIGDDMVMTYRDFGSGGGDKRIADYDPNTGTWSSTRLFTQGRLTGQIYDDVINSPSNRRNSYHNGFHADSTGRLHTTWTWREGTQDGNHDINYAYSDDLGFTWRNNTGQLVGTNSSPITLNSDVEVVDLDRTHALLNQQGQIVDVDGGVHVLMFHRPVGHGFTDSPFSDRGDSQYHHYYRDPATRNWEVTVLPEGTAVGSRGRMAADSNGNIFGVYVQGEDLFIAGALNDGDGYDWVILYREQSHDYDGTPQLDTRRLLNDGILSIYIQEDAVGATATTPAGAPLHVLDFSIEAPVPAPDAPEVLIAGWDTWEGSGVHAPDVTDGSTTGTTSKSGFINDSDQRASTDGTWGTLDTPAADITANDSGDAVRLINGSSGYYDFTVTDTGGTDRDLATFHFDAGTFRPNSARSYQLSVLSGDLSVGSVTSGVVPSIAGGVQDWTDFDIPLTGLADRTLDANGTVTFRLEFTGGTVGAGGHHQSLDNVAVTAEIPVIPPTLIAGWDSFSSTTAPASTSTAPGVTATATASASGGSWSNTDSGTDPGRGSSKDMTWGSFDGNGNPANFATNQGSDSFTLTNGKTDGELTFTITNGRTGDVDLSSFHIDALAFRPNAARTYALNVISGDLTIGNVFTSDVPSSDNSTNAITHVGGDLLTDNADPLTHDQHDDIDIDMTGLADHTLAAGESAVIQIAFSNGTGSGGGHHLFIENIAFSGDVAPSEFLLGDVNLDGVVNFLDIAPFIQVLTNGDFQAEADCDQNGTVNFLDIASFIGILSGS